MTERDFVSKNISGELKKRKFTWQAPSNIALIKYWGKEEPQIPKNPSLSFTLNSCRTTTSVSFSPLDNPSGKFDFEVYFENRKKKDFRPKIQKFLERAEKYQPFLKNFRFEIRSSNSFPHSSGIASSASGMAALALCLMSLEKALFPEISEEYFHQKASFLARLGSGSACRSIEGELVVWGESQAIDRSSYLYGIKYPHDVHENFKEFQDVILLVDKGEKQVSSSLGHNLMENHPFAEKRFQQARQNILKMKKILASGDLKEFIAIVESEALTLHAMMLTSQPHFILMKPNTLSILERITEFRKKTDLNVCFTLDAGANVHVLFPKKEKQEILSFIKNELLELCQNGEYIQDETGRGAFQTE